MFKLCKRVIIKFFLHLRFLFGFLSCLFSPGTLSLDFLLWECGGRRCEQQGDAFDSWKLVVVKPKLNARRNY